MIESSRGKVAKSRDRWLSQGVGNWVGWQGNLIQVDKTSDNTQDFRTGYFDFE